MKKSSIDIESNENITHIYLNRAHVRNAMDTAMMHDLIEALNQAQESPSCKAIYLKARGSHFSAGADLNWMRQQTHMSFEENKKDAHQLAKLMHQLDQINKPTVAFVQGCAYGGALGLIACCDIAVGHHDARFCFSEVKLGLIPSIISPYIMRSIGAAKCRTLMLSADVFHSQQAQSYGLLHETTDNFSPLEEKYQQLFAQNCSDAMAQVKQLLRDLSYQQINTQVIQHTTETIAFLRTQEEAQARMSRFLDQKKQ